MNNYSVSRLLKSIPGVVPIYLAPHHLRNWLREWRHTRKLSTGASKHFQANNASRLVVSLTSFPARIDNAWIPIECMFQQDVRPRRIVLVLSEEEFPKRMLPYVIERQIERGLELLWVRQNIKSYKKLLPTIEKYADHDVLTIDDDLLYPSDFIRHFVAAQSECPRAVIGGIGRNIRETNGALLPYATWALAGPDTPPSKLFLTGAGGVLYPSSALTWRHLPDYELARELCPTNDDIWFWAATVLSGLEPHCLLLGPPLNIRAQAKTPQLVSINVAAGRNDIQLQNVMARFPALRESVMRNDYR